MKINRFIATVVLVVIIFVAIIALFIYKTLTPGKDIHYGNNVATTTQSGLTPTSTTPGSNQPIGSDTHNGIDDCIALKANAAQGKDYIRGSLIVAFADALRYSTAVESMQILGLNPDSSQEGADNFEMHHWLTVSVPKGEEFKWQCQLEASEGVKKANLNITFNLHQ